MFLSGGTKALVTNSGEFSFSVLTLAGVDFTAVGVESFAFAQGDKFPYGATLIPGTERVMTSLSLTLTATSTIDLGVEPPAQTDELPLPGGPFVMGVAVDPAGEHAFFAHPADGSLSIHTISTGETRKVEGWLEDVGPTYTAVQP